MHYDLESEEVLLSTRHLHKITSPNTGYLIMEGIWETVVQYGKTDDRERPNCNLLSSSNRFRGHFQTIFKKLASL